MVAVAMDMRPDKDESVKLVLLPSDFSGFSAMPLTRRLHRPLAGLGALYTQVTDRDVLP